MSQKAQRGKKRTCHSCSSRFYDLGRAPAVCPMCQAVQPVEVRDNKAAAMLEAEAAKEAAAAKLKAAAAAAVKEFPVAEIVPGEELPDLGADELVIEGEEAEITPDESEETFLETEEETPGDVETFIDGPVDGEEEET